MTDVHIISAMMKELSVENFKEIQFNIFKVPPHPVTCTFFRSALQHANSTHCSS